jgi:hypothetical protein
MFCVAILERVLEGSDNSVHTALACIDEHCATALDCMLVCIRRVRALVRVSLDKPSMFWCWSTD